MTNAPNDVRVHGVLVTHRRPAQLAASLTALAGQTRRLDGLVVVDNCPTAENERVVRERVPGAEYVAARENLGPAGGIGVGMRRVLGNLDERDWIMTLDDDDPPAHAGVVAMLADFALESRGLDPATGAVGLSGTRFDRRAGRIVRVPDAELQGAVPVDCIAGNQCPLYSVGAVRAVGPPRPELFFGLEELEYGLRLRDAGYSLYGHGPTWYDGRAREGRLGARLEPARSLAEPTWRRYYSLRNLVWILREIEQPRSALQVTIVTGVAKPVANLAVRPRAALQHLRLSLAACRDAWTSRMGRTIEPPT